MLNLFMGCADCDPGGFVSAGEKIYWLFGDVGGELYVSKFWYSWCCIIQGKGRRLILQI